MFLFSMTEKKNREIVDSRPGSAVVLGWMKIAKEISLSRVMTGRIISLVRSPHQNSSV
jgi:hypothetical protein